MPRHSRFAALCIMVALAGFEPTLAGAGESGKTGLCRHGEEAYQALKLTMFSGGIRVDYRVVATGKQTWTNLNIELVRQFRVKVGSEFCMIQSKPSDQEVDFD